MSIKMRMPTLTSVRGQTLLTDNAPYLFRQSPIESQMLDDGIIGGTVAWNQLGNHDDFININTVTKNGVTCVYDASNNTFTLQAGGTATGNTTFVLSQNETALPAGTVFMVMGLPRTFNPNTEMFVNVYNGGNSNQFYRNMLLKLTKDVGSTLVISLFLRSGFSIDSDIVIKPIASDLTQMFGSSIADHVLALETQMIGSGIAWLRSYGFFTKDFYPFDSGSLLSVKTSGHVMRGFNWFDPNKIADESYYLNNDNSASSNQAWCYTDYIDIVGGQTYYFNNISGYSPSVCWYDGNKSFLGGVQNGTINSNGKKYTFPSDAHYIRVSIEKTKLDGYCINYSDDYLNGQYEPYSEPHTYQLSDIDLRGIPKLDASNNLYFDGDTYASDGTVTRRFGSVDLGTLNWSYSASDERFSATLPSQYGGTNRVQILCTKYEANSRVYMDADRTGGICCSTNAALVRDSNYTDAVSFKAAMNGVMLVYALATETTETTDAFENPQIAGTTEQYIDERTVPMPVGHETQYFNMVQIEKIQMHMPTA